MGLFEAHGYRVTHDDPEPSGEIAVVNTCGFIADAKEESINTILELVQAKDEGRLEWKVQLQGAAEGFGPPFAPRGGHFPPPDHSFSLCLCEDQRGVRP